MSPQSSTTATRRVYRPVDGVLLFDKPAGISSNGALQQVRRLYQAARAGHTGTLDPFATGLLPIAFGEATKFSAGLLEADKTYLATLRLGVRTSTGDPEGEVIDTREVRLERARVEQVLHRFTGVIAQTPPMYSALKHAGRPLYAYARAGESVERAARRVTIHTLDLLEWTEATLSVRVRCSKGTYIRVLAEDIGTELGCGAHLSALRRVAVGALHIDAAHGAEDLQALSEHARDALLLPIDTLVAGLPRVQLPAPDARRLLSGQVVPGPDLDDDPSPSASDPANGRSASAECSIRAYSAAGDFLGLVTRNAQGALRPLRLVQRTSI